MTTEEYSQIDWTFGLCRSFDALGVHHKINSLLPNGAIVIEIGSYAGISSLCWAGDDHKVFCIDPWNDVDYGDDKDNTASTIRKLGGGVALFNNFCKNVQNHLFKDVIPIRGLSTEIAAIFPFLIDFIFIDGEHTYKAVMDDFHSWKHLFKPSTILAFDDYGDYFSGIKLAVNEIVGVKNLESFMPEWINKSEGIVHCKAEKIWHKIKNHD